ncbi:hypothetical protein FVEN_g12768 [Fusarium venenatum]|uniref:Uncharacterized protein n=1 Tax=Fusarium venenatum TaxID=56646 RepID=A0A2L2TQX2_9HYPO|nr:uncharacterized protein FVRRES_02468 [Fusarium venenatum]KAG8357998.1 hypothetical protein FVEN_g12768 [Fusarium venenatum]CEI65956.1 unnamed protein product [Fusarium venenatum]
MSETKAKLCLLAQPSAEIRFVNSKPTLIQPTGVWKDGCSKHQKPWPKSNRQRVEIEVPQ